MAYGKIYIADLSKKVTDLFNELIDAKKLNEKEFISSFKENILKTMICWSMNGNLRYTHLRRIKKDILYLIQLDQTGY